MQIRNKKTNKITHEIFPASKEAYNIFTPSEQKTDATSRNNPQELQKSEYCCSQDLLLIKLAED